MSNIKAKRFFWLKLKKDFFLQPLIKSISRKSDGHALQICYIKILLLTLETEGRLIYQSIEESFLDEIALQIDEDPETVKKLIETLQRKNAAIYEDKNTIFFPYMMEVIGSECDSAERVRRYRNNKILSDNTDSLQCNADVTKCNTEKEKEIEKEIEIEIESDSEREREKNNPPALDEVKSFFQNENLTATNPETFFYHYESNGWKDNGGNRFDWKAKAKAWNAKDKNNPKASGNSKTGSATGGIWDNVTL